MTKSLVSLAVGSAIAFASTAATAAPFNSFDPRSMGMGGAGVAVGNTATAPFFNPAMLAATPDGDDFAIELPIVGGRFYDPDDFVDSVDDFQDDPTIFNANDDFILDQSIAAASAVDPDNFTRADIEDYRTVATDIDNLSSGLTGVSNKNIQAEVGAGTVIGIPSKNFGAALTATAWGAFGGVVNYEDETVLDNVAADLRTYAQCLEDTADAADANDPSLACDYTTLDLNYVDTDPNDDGPGTSQAGDVLFDPNDDLASSVDVRGILLTEIGLSMAREFQMNGSTLAVGITPKYQKAKVYDYRADVNTADEEDFDAEDHVKEHKNFNVDVGIAKSYDNGWRTGFVVKNLIAQEYETVRGNEVKLNPQARVGISHQNEWSTVALDVDLTENEPVDFEEGSRYVALGAELNAFDWAQLRVGYRADTVNSDRNVASVGIGLSPFGVHLDLAAAKGANELGASAQFGVRF